METDTEKSPLLQHNPRNVMINRSQEDAGSIQNNVSNNSKAAKGPQIIAALVACLAPLTFGTVMGYSSPTIQDLYAEGLLNNKEQESWFASVISLGAMAGGLIGGVFAEKLGRKGTIIACGVPYAIGWLMIMSVGYIKSFALLIGGRVITGTTTGIVMMAAPIYTAEIATPEMRGPLGNLFQLANTFGVLLAYVFGIPLKYQWLALAMSALSTLMSILCFFIPESPIYLAAKGQEAETVRTLKWLRGSKYDYSGEYRTIVSNLNRSNTENVDWKDVFTKKVLYKPIIITAVLMMFQQCSGINDFVFYTKPIFESAGYTGNAAIPEVIVGSVLIGATLLSVFAIGFFGRKSLIILSSTLMSTGCYLMGVYYYMKDSHSINWLPLPSYILYIIGYSIGWGPVGWTLLGELTPTKVKGFAVGLAIFVNRAGTFVVTKNFLSMQDTLTKQGAFWLLAGINVISLMFVVVFVPETKGRTLSEIEHLFEN